MLKSASILWDSFSLKYDVEVYYAECYSRATFRDHYYRCDPGYSGYSWHYRRHYASFCRRWCRHAGSHYPYSWRAVPGSRVWPVDAEDLGLLGNGYPGDTGSVERYPGTWYAQSRDWHL